MSNQNDSSALNEAVPHHVYFEGKVQSLGLQTANGKATLGVMKKGTYTFSTSSAEKIIIITGSMTVRLAGGDYQQYSEKEEFDVVAGTSFDVVCDDDVAYLCYYG